ELRVMDVDAAVQHTADYTGAAGLARVHGRGGTDMRVGIAAALDLKPRPHGIVVFTDAETHPGRTPNPLCRWWCASSVPRRKWRPSGCRSGRSQLSSKRTEATVSERFLQQRIPRICQ